MDEIEYNLDPREDVTTAGSNAVVKGIGNAPLTSCYFKTFNSKGNQPWISLEHDSSNSTYRYVGSGLNESECGIEIFDVTPDMSGFIISQAGTQETNSADMTTLIVSSKPLLSPFRVSNLKVCLSDRSFV